MRAHTLEENQKTPKGKRWNKHHKNRKGKNRNTIGRRREYIPRSNSKKYDTRENNSITKTNVATWLKTNSSRIVSELLSVQNGPRMLAYLKHAMSICTGHVSYPKVLSNLRCLDDVTSIHTLRLRKKYQNDNQKTEKRYQNENHLFNLP